MTVTEDRTDLNGSRNTSHFENESWAEKPWKKFEKVVFRLQKRIYKASREGNFRKVKKLQRLLLKCRSAKFLAIRQVRSCFKTLRMSFNGIVFCICHTGGSRCPVVGAAHWIPAFVGMTVLKQLLTIKDFAAVKHNGYGSVCQGYLSRKLRAMLCYEL